MRALLEIIPKCEQDHPDAPELEAAETASTADGGQTRIE
jgi:hypothetical protein